MALSPVALETSKNRRMDLEHRQMTPQTSKTNLGSQISPKIARISQTLPPQLENDVNLRCQVLPQCCCDHRSSNINMPIYVAMVVVVALLPGLVKKTISNGSTSRLNKSPTEQPNSRQNNNAQASKPMSKQSQKHRPWPGGMRAAGE